MFHNHSQQNTTAKASLAHFSSVPGKLQQGREKGCVQSLLEMQNTTCSLPQEVRISVARGGSIWQNQKGMASVSGPAMGF